MRAGIIRFPGSNCDFDTINFFRKFGHNADFIWHKDRKLPRADIIILPGGFAFGDRDYAKATEKYVINPGALALKSPIMKAVCAAANNGTPILGVCNGFQILTKAGLLPGKLAGNDSGKFFCDYVACEVSGSSFFRDEFLIGRTFTIPVAHGYGKYIIDGKSLGELENNGQIFLKYKNFNPNGSMENIAGVSNKAGNVFGMMPHPERSPDGQYFIKAIEKYVGK